MLPATDSWFKKGRETNRALSSEKLVSLAANVSETLLSFTRDSTKNQCNYSLLKPINVRAHLLYKNQLQDSSLTNQSFISLAGIYCCEAEVEACIPVYPCNYSLCPFSCLIYLGTLSSLIAACQRDVVN